MSGAILHGGGITQAAAQFGGRPQDWLDLSTGINPHSAPLPEIPVTAWHRLPDQYLMDEAQNVAALYYGSGSNLPLPVPGTQSVIQLLPRLAVPGRRVAIFAPTYGEYARAFAEAGFGIDQITSRHEISTSHGLVVLVNPNNPTGRTFPVEEVESIRKTVVAQGSILLVDEAFADYEPESGIARGRRDMEGLIVFRSFGKFFGLAGLRLGFVIASPQIANQFREWLGPWAVSGPALVIASALMTDGSAAPIRASIRERKMALEAVLQRAGLSIAGGTALFSLVEHDRASDLFTHLCRAHILTRRFDYAPKWLRIGLAPGATGDKRLADALRLSGL